MRKAASDSRESFTVGALFPNRKWRSGGLPLPWDGNDGIVMSDLSLNWWATKVTGRTTSTTKTAGLRFGWKCPGLKATIAISRTLGHVWPAHELAIRLPLSTKSRSGSKSMLHVRALRGAMMKLSLQPGSASQNLLKPDSEIEPASFRVGLNFFFLYCSLHNTEVYLPTIWNPSLKTGVGSLVSYTALH